MLLTVVDEEGEEHHITPGGDWTWTYPEGDDMQPKVAQFVIAVNNNEIDGQRWRLAVTVVNRAGEFEYSWDSNDLAENAEDD